MLSWFFTCLAIEHSLILKLEKKKQTCFRSSSNSKNESSPSPRRRLGAPAYVPSPSLLTPSTAMPSEKNPEAQRGGAACLQPQKGTRHTDLTPSPGLFPPHPIVYQTKFFFFLVKCEVSQSIWVGARDSKRTQVLSRAGLASKQTSLYKGRASVGPGTQLSVQYERKACHDELY